jgi:outer membrane protein insertion porin family
MHTPSRIASVRVEGAVHSRKGFLGWLIEPHLAKAGLTETSTFETALHATRGIAHTLKETDLFSSVEPRLEATRDVFAKDGDVDLVLRTREKGRFYVKGGTEVGNGEGSAVRIMCHLTKRDAKLISS